MMYAVFFIKDGKWAFVQTYWSLESARKEVDYLVTHFGVTARVFKRK